MTRDTDEHGKLALADLPMYWQGRANAFRILNDKRDIPDAHTSGSAQVYAECAEELRAALRIPAGHAEREALREAAFKLSCHDQFRLATFIAENVGYVLAPEPSFHDEPAAPADTEDQGPDTLGERP